MALSPIMMAAGLQRTYDCTMVLHLANSMGTTYSPEAVFNQPPVLEDYNVFDSDCALKEAVHREGGGWMAEARALGKPETINLGVLANRFPPELCTHDRFGHRIDEVTYSSVRHTLQTLQHRPHNRHTVFGTYQTLVAGTLSNP
jgi:hypothetical protein